MVEGIGQILTGVAALGTLGLAWANGRKLKTGNGKTIGRTVEENTTTLNDLVDAFHTHDSDPDAHKGLD